MLSIKKLIEAEEQKIPSLKSSGFYKKRISEEELPLLIESYQSIQEKYNNKWKLLIPWFLKTSVLMAEMDSKMSNVEDTQKNIETFTKNIDVLIKQIPIANKEIITKIELSVAKRIKQLNSAHLEYSSVAKQKNKKDLIEYNNISKEILELIKEDFKSIKEWILTEEETEFLQVQAWFLKLAPENVIKKYDDFKKEKKEQQKKEFVKKNNEILRNSSYLSDSFSLEEERIKKELKLKEEKELEELEELEELKINDKVKQYQIELLVSKDTKLKENIKTLRNSIGEVVKRRIENPESNNSKKPVLIDQFNNFLSKLEQEKNQLTNNQLKVKEEKLNQLKILQEKEIADEKAILDRNFEKEENWLFVNFLEKYFSFNITENDKLKVSRKEIANFTREFKEKLKELDLAHLKNTFILFFQNKIIEKQKRLNVQEIQSLLSELDDADNLEKRKILKEKNKILRNKNFSQNTINPQIFENSQVNFLELSKIADNFVNNLGEINSKSDVYSKQKEEALKEEKARNDNWNSRKEKIENNYQDELKTLNDYMELLEYNQKILTSYKQTIQKQLEGLSKTEQQVKIAKLEKEYSSLQIVKKYPELEELSDNEQQEEIIQLIFDKYPELRRHNQMILHLRKNIIEKEIEINFLKQQDSKLKGTNNESRKSIYTKILYNLNKEKKEIENKIKTFEQFSNLVIFRNYPGLINYNQTFFSLHKKMEEQKDIVVLKEPTYSNEISKITTKIEINQESIKTLKDEVNLKIESLRKKFEKLSEINKFKKNLKKKYESLFKKGLNSENRISDQEIEFERTLVAIKHSLKTVKSNFSVWTKAKKIFSLGLFKTPEEKQLLKEKNDLINKQLNQELDKKWEIWLKDTVSNAKDTSKTNALKTEKRKIINILQNIKSLEEKNVQEEFKKEQLERILRIEKEKLIEQEQRIIENKENFLSEQRRKLKAKKDNDLEIITKEKRHQYNIDEQKKASRLKEFEKGIIACCLSNNFTNQAALFNLKALYGEKIFFDIRRELNYQFSKIEKADFWTRKNVLNEEEENKLILDAIKNSFSVVSENAVNQSTGKILSRIEIKTLIEKYQEEIKKYEDGLKQLEEKKHEELEKLIESETKATEEKHEQLRVQQEVKKEIWIKEKIRFLQERFDYIIKNTNQANTDDKILQGLINQFQIARKELIAEINNNPEKHILTEQEQEEINNFRQRLISEYEEQKKLIHKKYDERRTKELSDLQERFNQKKKIENELLMQKFEDLKEESKGSAVEVRWFNNLLLKPSLFQQFFKELGNSSEITESEEDLSERQVPEIVGNADILSAAVSSSTVKSEITESEEDLSERQVPEIVGNADILSAAVSSSTVKSEITESEESLSERQVPEIVGNADILSDTVSMHSTGENKELFASAAQSHF